MKPNLLNLVYTSQAREWVTAQALEDILPVSRRRNENDGITGFLAVRGDCFLQLLEGPAPKVRECYGRILLDRRHSGIILQGEAFTDLRMMPDWDMGLVEMDETSPSNAHLLTLFELGRRREAHADPEALQMLLRKFSRDAGIPD